MTNNKLKDEKGKASLAHGVQYFIRTGQLPSGRGMRKLRKYLEELEADLVGQLGGIEVVTPQQAVTLRGYIKAHSICALIEVFMNKHGVLRPDQQRRKILQLHPVLERSYIQYQRLAKDLLEQLFPGGLARPAQPAESLDEHIAKTYDREDKS